jgi:inorganic pyrophosphatase
MFNHIKIGDSKPKSVNVIIEIPKETHNKYEYDERLGIIRLDRVLHSPMHYPVDYGFIPETRSDDGDHLDVMVLTDSSVFSGCMLEVRPIGALIIKDKKENDEKILAVPLRHPNYAHIKKLSQVPDHLLKEIAQFFADYKKLEDVDDPVVEGWVNRLEAYKIIRQAYKTFKEEQKD